jgi:hypothetical protein
MDNDSVSVGRYLDYLVHDLRGPLLHTLYSVEFALRDAGISEPALSRLRAARAECRLALRMLGRVGLFVDLSVLAVLWDVNVFPFRA